MKVPNDHESFYFSSAKLLQNSAAPSKKKKKNGELCTCIHNYMKKANFTEMNWWKRYYSEERILYNNYRLSPPEL